MKKFITIILALTLLSAAAMPSFAQGRSSRTYSPNQQTYSRGYNDRGQYDRDRNNRGYNDRGYDNRRWDSHRDKVTVVGGTVAGALLGAIIGGRKGAIIGAAAGAGTSALYTYKLRDHHRRF